MWLWVFKVFHKKLRRQSGVHLSLCLISVTYDCWEDVCTLFNFFSQHAFFWVLIVITSFRGRWYDELHGRHSLPAVWSYRCLLNFLLESMLSLCLRSNEILTGSILKFMERFVFARVLSLFGLLEKTLSQFSDHLSLCSLFFSCLVREFLLV